MHTAKLTAKGQITLPREIRDLLGVVPGDQVDFVIEQGGVVRLVSLRRSVRGLAGILAVPGREAPSLEEIDDSIAGLLAADDERTRRGG